MTITYYEDRCLYMHVEKNVKRKKRNLLVILRGIHSYNEK